MGLVPMVTAALAAAGLMIATRCLASNEARRAIEWEALLLIAASFGLARAMETTGLANTIAEAAVAAAGNEPRIVLAAIYLVTMLTTELLSNNAAAVLTFPIAWQTAHQLGVHPLPFGMAMAEAVGVAAAFAVANDSSPAQVASDEAAIAAIRTRLLERGAFLPPVAERTPAGPSDHPHYQDYRTMLRWGLAVGGYGNDPGLDQEVPATALLYLLANVGPRAYGQKELGAWLVGRFGHPIGGLTPALAAAHLGTFLELAGVPDLPWGGRTATYADLKAFGLPLPDPGGPLRRGEVYALGAFALDVIGRRHPPTPTLAVAESPTATEPSAAPRR